MAVLTPEQYSRSQTVDLETALSLAVLRAIDQEYPGPGGIGKIRFAALFEDWPSFEDSAIFPTAAVLPTSDLTYGPSHPTPKLLEDTWEKQGEPGLGLYELSEAEREFEIQFRGATTAERNAVLAGLQAAFVAPEILMSPPFGSRYGILETMPEYWGLTARFTLMSSRKLDDQDTAAKNIAEGLIRVRAQAQHVRLGIVQPFRAIIREIVQ